MPRIAFLTDRSPSEALPALSSLGVDVKTAPLAQDALAHAAELGPIAVVVDGASDPGRAHALLEGCPSAWPVLPVVVVVSSGDVEAFDWAEVADELLDPSADGPEIRTRLAMVSRRAGEGREGGEATYRMGPLALDVATYRSSVAGRQLDLTYREFELLRFLAAHAGRVYTRTELLQAVWGYPFYGGTRTVDVHIRRLRAKLGPEHESIIETVRGVGYGLVRPDDES